MNYKYLTIGIIIGCILTFSTGILASTITTVSAIKADNVVFEFDGEIKDLPEGYTVLMYNDRTYVPARFIAEELGAEVNWCESTKTVSIDSKKIDPCPEPKPDPEPEKEIEPEDKEAVQPKGNYRRLPLSALYKDMEITATLVTLERDHARVYITMMNKESPPLQVLQGKTKAIVDGKEYSTEEIPFYLRDDKWYNDIQRDETIEGYLALPVIPEESEEMRLIITVLQNDRTQKEREVELDISLDIIVENE